MKKIIILILAIILTTSFVSAEDINNSVLLEKLNELEQKIDDVDNKVDDIKTGVNLIYDILGTVFSRITRLFLGWVSSSSPYPSDVSIEQGLSSIQGCYQHIFSHQNGSWKSYNPLRQTNTLDKLSPDYGYWIKINCSEINWQIVILEENCTNSFDDDLDTKIDCNDTNCSSHPDCQPAANGESCTQNNECQSNLCVDGVCCNSICAGLCEACNIQGSAGTCSNIVSGEDPDNECGAVSCNSYYWGWSGDNCYDRDDLSAANVNCDGSGSCQSAADLCSSQGQGYLVLTCHPICQQPTAGTCTGTTPGACTNINPGTHSCGIGECYRNVPQCAQGAPNPCIPGIPTEEVCDGLDNDCDSQTDEGSLCILAHATSSCTSGQCVIDSCDTGYDNCDQDTSNGCETDLMNDESHCGSCGNACEPLQQCSGGYCLA